MSTTLVGTTASVRRGAIRSGVPDLIRRCQEVAPRRGIIICLAAVYKEVAPLLQAADPRLLHHRAIPFPLGNWKAEFIEDFRRAISDG